MLSKWKVSVSMYLQLRWRLYIKDGEGPVSSRYWPVRRGEILHFAMRLVVGRGLRYKFFWRAALR